MNGLDVPVLTHRSKAFFGGGTRAHSEISTPTQRTTGAPAAPASADSVVAPAATTTSSSASASVVTSTVTTSSPPPKRTMSLGEYQKERGKSTFTSDELQALFDTGSDADMEDCEGDEEASSPRRVNLAWDRVVLVRTTRTLRARSALVAAGIDRSLTQDRCPVRGLEVTPLRLHCHTAAVWVSERDMNGYTGVRVPEELTTLGTNLIEQFSSSAAGGRNTLPRAVGDYSSRSSSTPFGGFGGDGLRTPLRFPECHASGRSTAPTYRGSGDILSNEYENDPDFVSGSDDQQFAGRSSALPPCAARSGSGGGRKTPRVWSTRLHRSPGGC
ncbi:unnamed protein product [Phytophthora fragariaefolia]|uniref:Unnamed protein product n=1 Tax=Phytophthora fragariaefolia TaxID=1490495 RepID=A0A9W6TS09_9STRA|nr:unnamed protein product [Phytophthora fragariaefolia]